MSIGTKMRGVGESTYYTKLLKPQLEEVLNGSSYEMEHILGKRKLVVHTDKVDDEKYDSVTSLLKNSLSKNVRPERYNQSIEIPWKNWISEYKQLDYLESVDSQYVHIPINGSTRDEIYIEAAKRDVTPSWSNLVVIGNALGYDFSDMCHSNNVKEDGIVNVGWYLDPLQISGLERPPIYSWWTWSYTSDTRYTQRWDGKTRKLYFNDNLVSTFSSNAYTPDCATLNVRLFKSTWSKSAGILYSVKYVNEEGKTLVNAVAALDPTGAPCIINTSTRIAYYNSGTGDFLYPGKETESSTYSLRNSMYAKLTETGIRRLYHVPENYYGTKEDYAVENGYKLLIETPAPQEGNWEPEWYETEDQIICNWIETESLLVENITEIES